jgi:hypothetical protein
VHAIFLGALTHSGVHFSFLRQPIAPMTPEEREQMNQLCKSIQEETDHAKYLQLVHELIELIAVNERRIDPRNRR